MEKRPNFFIVGAPKAGTTSLAEYLRQHPNAFITDPKEPNFFGEDLPLGIRFVQTKEAYLKLYTEAPDEASALGEASTWGLYSQQALKEIYAFNPNAKIIAMLRNPIDLVPSLHSQLNYSMNDLDTDLESSWSKNAERAAHSDKTPCSQEFILCYDKVAKLGEQLKRLYSIFPSEQIHFIFLDDLKQSPDQVYKQVLDFLNLPQHELKSYKQHNPNKEFRSYWLGKLLTPKNRHYLAFTKKIRALLGIKYIGLLSGINKLNIKHSVRPKPSKEMHNTLVSTFSEDVHLLENITNRDLSHWLN